MFIAECPQNISPLATFAVNVIIALYRDSESLLTAHAFTAIALINILTIPVIQLVQIIPQLLQCVGSLERIQEYCNHTGDAAEYDESREHSNYGESSISLHPLARVVSARSENDQKHVITLDLLY